MTLSRRTRAAMLFALLALAVGDLAEAAEVCKQIHASLQSHVVSCAGPLGLCTEGQVVGEGLIRGGTFFVATGLAPHAGMPGVEPATTFSDAGTWTVTTAHGTLTTSSVGILDQAAGLFFDLGRVSAGTGRFDGATGTLFFFGTVLGTFPAVSFEGDIRGEVCLVK